MTNDRGSRFHECMTILAAALEVELAPEREGIYAKFLKQYSIEQIEMAATLLIKRHKIKTFPMIADFVEILEGSEDDAASVAWHKLLAGLHKPGPYETVDFGDPYLHQAAIDCNLWGMGIETNGYPDNKPKREEDFIRIEFCKRYKFHKAHSNPSMLAQKLTGILEHVNKQKIALGEAENWTPAQKALAGGQETLRILPTPERKKLG